MYKNNPRPYKDGELAKVKFATNGVVGKLIINGVDLSMCCEEVTIHQGGGETASIGLKIIPDVVEVNGDFKVLGSMRIGKGGNPQPVVDTDADI